MNRPRHRPLRGREDKDEAENEIGQYQSITANMLMMGTLVFGFCATGTFLSVSFTGDEVWDNDEQFVDFLRYGCYAALSSLTASMIAFISATRVSNQHIQYGSAVALRIVQKSTIFIVLAEMLLYFSLHEFMNSISVYASLMYSGPILCPQGGGQADDRPDLWLNNSFCAQFADEFYNVASSMCGDARQTEYGPPPAPPPPATFQKYVYGPVTQWASVQQYADNGPQRNVSDSAHPFATCTAFDYYTSVSAGVACPWWFAWDWGDSGYPILEIRHEMSQRNAFLKVLNEIADHACGKPDAERAVNELCTSNFSSSADCAQARTAFLATDSCSGAKQDDGLRCNRVCTWLHIGKEWIPLKQVIRHELEFWMTAMIYVIRFIMVYRFIAGLARIHKNCQQLGSDIQSCRGIVSFMDAGGILDTLECYERMETPSDDDSFKAQPFEIQNDVRNMGRIVSR